MPRIRPLTEQDLDGCLALAVDRGWPPEREKWRYLLRFGAGYGACEVDGTLVGTALLTRFGNGTAAISMVLTAARCERRGIGAALLRHTMRAAGEDTLLLYATDLGRPLYERLGFRAVDGVATHLGHFACDSPGPPETRVAQAADLAELVRLDTEATGCDRSGLLRGRAVLGARLVVTPSSGRPTGYGAIWFSHDKWVIGPVIAAQPAAARAIIAELGTGRNHPVRVDLTGAEPALRDWVVARGLVRRGQSTLMVHGGRSLPGNRERLFAPFMQALG